MFFIIAVRACNHRDLGATGAACQLFPPLRAGFNKSQFYIYPTQGPGDRLITLDLDHRPHPLLVQKLHAGSSLAQEPHIIASLCSSTSSQSQGGGVRLGVLGGRDRRMACLTLAPRCNSVQHALPFIS